MLKDESTAELFNVEGITKSFLRWKPTLFILLDTRQTGVDLTVPPNMAAARVGSGNTRITTSQKG